MQNSLLGTRSFSFISVLLILLSMCAGFFTLVTAPAVAVAATTDCGCAGNYVSPAAKAPSVAQPADGGTSPGGTYTLAVFASALTVKNAKSGQTLLSLSGLTGDFHAGFSPNDSGFAVWTESAAGGHIALYDLSSKSPSHIVWSNDYLGNYSVGFSPHGKYFLVAAPANVQFTDLKVVNATTGAYAYTNQAPGNTDWGFSPDDQRLVLWSGNNGGGATTSTVILYDLSAGRQVWRTDGAFGSVSLAFSPHGTYFVSAAITNGSQASLVVVPAAASSGGNTPAYSNSFTLYSPPGQGKDTFGSAAWGFSPDKADATFVFDAVNGPNGASIVMVSLPAGTSHTLSYTTVVAGHWQFSPCGDVLGVVIQPRQAASVDVGLYSSSTGQALTTTQFNSLNVALKATPSNHVATVDGTDYNLAKNAGNAGCSNGGGNGSGSGGSTGNGNSGGSGSGTGNGNGGGAIPCPGCYQPPIVLDDLQVNPMVAVGGSPVTGMITTANGGAVSLRSSDPAVAAVPAVVDAASGATTFTINTSTVTKDTIVTVSATAGGTTKSARLVVEATCSTSEGPGTSAYAITAAPINGGGGPGPHGGGLNRPTAVVSVDPIVVESGATVTGAVTLSDAPKRDTTFMLSASDTGVVSVPASVTVPAGATTATFPLTAGAVSSDEFVTLSARSAGYLSLAGTIVVVQPPMLASLTLSSSAVTGGTSVTGTVTLSGADPACRSLTVDLTSSNPGAATTPASVTIAAGAGSATFTVATSAVTSDQEATITGELSGVTQSADLAVKVPTAPGGGSNDNFADAAPLDLPGIATGNTDQATMEGGEPHLTGSCMVLPGFTVSHSVWFKITPSQSGILTVSTANPGTSLDSVLALYADPGSAGLSGLGTPLGCDNNADALASADSASGDATLYHEEHTGPDAGTLGGLPTWSSIMHVSVTAGQTYYIQLGGVGGAPAGPYVLTAEVNPSIPLPSLLDSVSVSSSSVAAGGSVTGAVTLSAPAPAGGVIVALSSSDATKGSVPQSVVVPGGADHADFAVQTSTAAAGTTVTVTASFDGRQRTAGLSITGP
jgi:hypothetical protein